MVKKHLVVISNRQNIRLQEIKKILDKDNVNDTFTYLIDNFGEEDEAKRSVR